MIRGGEFLNFSAILTVNNHFFGEVHDASCAKDEIDAQAVLTMEGAAAIIPPRKFLGVGVSVSEQVRQPRVHKRLKSSALFLGVENGSLAGFATPAIDGLGNDIKVAADDFVGYARIDGLPLGGQIVVPRQLAGKVRVLEVFSVRAIHCGELKLVIDVCGNQP